MRNCTAVDRGEGAPGRPAAGKNYLGRILRERRIEVLGPVNLGKLAGVRISPENLPRFMELLENRRYFAIGQGVPLNRIAEIFITSGLNGLMEKGPLVLAIGNFGGVLSSLPKYLGDAEEAVKTGDLKAAAQAWFWASALAREKGDGVDICARISRRILENNPAEYLMLNRSPQPVIDLLIQLGDHELNLDLLRQLSQLTRQERTYGDLKKAVASAISDKPKDAALKILKKFIKKNQLSETRQAAYENGYALETELEVVQQLLAVFKNQASYFKHCVEMNLEEGYLEGADDNIDRARRAGVVDRDIFNLADRRRNAVVEGFLKENSAAEKTLDGLFAKLQAGALKPEEFEAVLNFEIGFEYFIYRILRMLNENRLAAYRTVERLKIYHFNDPLQARKVSELKNGIFGRILNEAVGGQKLSAEEEKFVQRPDLLTAYAQYNPERLQFFLGQIKLALQMAHRNGREAVNSEAIKRIYKFLALKDAIVNTEEALAIVDTGDGEEFPILRDAEMSHAGRKLIALGRAREALPLARAYNANRAGCAGYEIEVAALTELDRYEEARDRLEETGFLIGLKDFPAVQKAVREEKPYSRVEIDELLARLIDKKATEAKIDGRRKIWMHGYHPEPMSRLLIRAEASAEMAEGIMDRLGEVFKEEARSLGGMPAALGFQVGLLWQDQDLKSVMSETVREAHKKIFPQLHKEILRFFEREGEVAHFLRPMLERYAVALNQSGHFDEARQIFELLIKDLPKKDIRNLEQLRLIFLTAINYADVGDEAQAIKLHRKIAQVYLHTSGTWPEESRDYFARNFAILSGLVTDPAEKEQYLAQALQLPCDMKSYRVNVATTLVFLKRYAEAEPLLNKVLAEELDSISAIHDLSLVYLETGRSDRVWGLVSRYVRTHAQLAPYSIWVNNLLYLLAEKYGQEEARRAFKKNTAAYTHEELCEWVADLPGFMLRRLSPEFRSYLRLDT